MSFLVATGSATPIAVGTIGTTITNADTTATTTLVTASTPTFITASTTPTLALLTGHRISTWIWSTDSTAEVILVAGTIAFVVGFLWFAWRVEFSTYLWWYRTLKRYGWLDEYWHREPREVAASIDARRARRERAAADLDPQEPCTTSVFPVFAPSSDHPLPDEDNPDEDQEQRAATAVTPSAAEQMAPGVNRTPFQASVQQPTSRTTVVSPLLCSGSFSADGHDSNLAQQSPSSNLLFPSTKNDDGTYELKQLDVGSMSVQELRCICHGYRLDQEGSRPDLLQRLTSYSVKRDWSNLIPLNQQMHKGPHSSETTKNPNVTAMEDDNLNTVSGTSATVRKGDKSNPAPQRKTRAVKSPSKVNKKNKSTATGSTRGYLKERERKIKEGLIKDSTRYYPPTSLPADYLNMRQSKQQGERMLQFVDAIVLANPYVPRELRNPPAVQSTRDLQTEVLKMQRSMAEKLDMILAQSNHYSFPNPNEVSSGSDHSQYLRQGPGYMPPAGNHGSYYGAAGNQHLPVLGGLSHFDEGSSGYGYPAAAGSQIPGATDPTHQSAASHHPGSKEFTSPGPGAYYGAAGSRSLPDELRGPSTCSEHFTRPDTARSPLAGYNSYAHPADGIVNPRAAEPNWPPAENHRSLQYGAGAGQSTATGHVPYYSVARSQLVPAAPQLKDPSAYDRTPAAANQLPQVSFKDKFPDPPKDDYFSAGSVAGMQTLVARWDPDFPEWDPTLDHFRIQGRPIPLKEYRDIWRGTPAWSVIRQRYSLWKKLVTTYKELGENTFWKKFSDPEGKPFGYTRLERVIGQENQIGEKEQAELIRKAIGSSFDSIFVYRKSGQNVVISDAKSIIRKYQSLPHTTAKERKKNSKCRTKEIHHNRTVVRKWRMDALTNSWLTKKGTPGIPQASANKQIGRTHLNDKRLNGSEDTNRKIRERLQAWRPKCTESKGPEGIGLSITQSIGKCMFLNFFATPICPALLPVQSRRRASRVVDRVTTRQLITIAQCAALVARVQNDAAERIERANAVSVIFKRNTTTNEGMRLEDLGVGVEDEWLRLLLEKRASSELHSWPGALRLREVPRGLHCGLADDLGNGQQGRGHRDSSSCDQDARAYIEAKLLKAI
ncbi:hypothetical protein B0H11DRAFT_1916758 [Mycena galericulata]|nr:hypothetical protein B0H11DRAFT_1916758 [Mycena galericulata]